MTFSPFEFDIAIDALMEINRQKQRQQNTATV